MPKTTNKTTSKNQVINQLQKKTGNPHDQFFKVIYSSPENALDLFKIILPKDFYNQCNWKTLKAEKRDWIGKQADLIFSVALKTFPKRRIKIVLLIEHKSYYSKDLFKQVLNYQNSIYQEDQSGDILAVIPILFFITGKNPINGKFSFKKGYFGRNFSKIPVFIKENMLDYNLIVFDTNNPSRVHKRNLLNTVFQEPYRGGKDLHGAPFLSIHKIPLITIRWSFHWFPGRPFGGNISLIFFHCVSVNVYFFMLEPPC